jgi:predicted amidohydrolase
MNSPSRTLRISCLQVTAGNDLDENVQAALELVDQSVAAGADFVLMPENVTMMEWGRKAIISKAQRETDHKGLAAFQECAQRHGIWIHTGSLSISLDDGRVANRTYVLNDKGEVAAQYDKIHMFDVDLGGGERYAESSTFAPGDKAVIVDLPWGRLGLTICYDLRFPSLYRNLGKAGAEIIAVPSAFTQVTGDAHWHVLLRARAIETGSFIVAPAQTGSHPGDRKTFGHALIIDPWGRVVADAGTEPGFKSAEIDLSQVEKVRKRMPSLSHGRQFEALSEKMTLTAEK